MIKVLALDIATTTGWALHYPGLERPFFGFTRFPGAPGEFGRTGDAFERFLRDLWTLHNGFTHMFFEAQYIGRGMSPETAYRLIGLSATAEKFAYQTGMHCYKSSIGEWKKHFLGRGGGFKSAGLDSKEMAVRRCAQYGWHTASKDAADALGILDFSLSLIPGYVRPWRDKIFMGGTGLGTTDDD